MKNNKLSRYIFLALIILISLLFLFLVINKIEYDRYTYNLNNKVSSIINSVQEKYPNLTEKEIIEILNNNDNNSKFLEKYSIYDKSAIIENDNYYSQFLIINILIIVLSFMFILLLFIKYNKNREKEINDITKYLEELNKKNYYLKIDSNTEDELSILRNEIYKTTVMLKEIAENSLNDKLNLKESLENISHQLKTPLTSILVMLDNLIDDPDMDKNIRNDFIMDIKKQIININFLVQAILKLSKFDSNTIHFIKEKVLLKDIIDEAVKNVSVLCDLKNIIIEIKSDNGAQLDCDFKWQVEAITNIIKNCIEHSKNNQKIEIKYGSYNVYSYIEIKDYGNGISQKDIKHIFERFYKGENSANESIGIGLALSKAIIEEDNGNIDVESSNKGTKFVIKYFV